MSPTANPTFVAIHSDLRWLVLAAALAAIIVSISGSQGGRPFQPLGRKIGAIYTGILDLQFILGLYLYATSPVVSIAWSNLSAAMKIKELRFFAVEHLTAMVLAVIVAHVGSIRSKRASSDRDAYSRAALWYAMSLLLLLAGIPWGRPLFRVF